MAIEIRISLIFIDCVMHEYYIGYHEQQRSKRRKIHVPKSPYLLTTGGTEMLVRKRWITPIGEAHFDLLASSANSLLLLVTSAFLKEQQGGKTADKIFRKQQMGLQNGLIKHWLIHVVQCKS